MVNKTVTATPKRCSTVIKQTDSIFSAMPSDVDESHSTRKMVNIGIPTKTTHNTALEIVF